MVNVKIRVRPNQAYHYPFKVESLEINSYSRLETIQEKYSATGSTTRLYFNGHELPLNSSIGSHNFEDHDILECCRSPAISAALSSCLKDMDAVKNLSTRERTRENLERILQVPPHVRNMASFWNSWSEDKLKSRLINMAIMKLVVQRQDRYQVHDLPHCHDCQSLFDALESHNVWRAGDNGKKFQQQAHIFKPQKNDGSGPTTNWILLEEKLRIQQQIQNEFWQSLSHFERGESPSEDYLEEFVRRDHKRHNPDQGKRPQRKRGRSQSKRIVTANVVALEQYDNSDAFVYSILDSARTSSSVHHQHDPEILPAASSPGRRLQPKPYIPQYASGPYAVLATLYSAMNGKYICSEGKRLLTLTEEQLKRFAQPRCRSNLYDKQRMRSRNAFACMDGLIEKQLVRKEIVRNTSEGGDIEKWGLLQAGEILGRLCAEFDRAVDQVLPMRKFECKTPAKELALCFDNREDAHFLQRMKRSCKDENVPFIEKELPAGDYLFLRRDGSNEHILPIVIERKTWSDLAESCLDKGKVRNRLDCVKIGGDSTCRGDCQLCKMKRSGCTQILFIIEGERCSGSGGVHASRGKCDPPNDICSACKQLHERHKVTQSVLEGVITKLQVDHGCHIHYTRNFNETVTSLFIMRSLLQNNFSFASQIFRGSGNGMNATFCYESYASNARKGGWYDWKVTVSSQNLQEWDIESLSHSISGGEWNPSLMKEVFGINHYIPVVGTTNKKKRKAERKSPSNGDAEIFMTNANCEDDEGIIDLVDPCEMKRAVKLSRNTHSRRRKRQNQNNNGNDTICIDSDSDVEVICDGGSVKSSCQKFVRLDEDVFEVAVLKNDAPSGKDNLDTHTTMNDADIKVVDSTEPRRKSPLFLIIHSWEKYDQSVGKLLDKCWRSTFSADDGDFGEFFENAVINLTGVIHSTKFPLIHRKTLMEFELWLQLIVGVHVRSVQLLESAIFVRNHHNDTAAKTIVSVPCRKEPPQFLQCSPSGAITKKSISTPLRNNVSPKKSSKTSYLTESWNKDKDIAFMQPSTNNEESDSIRQARLRRFDKASPTQRQVSVNHLVEHSTSDRWSCANCTYLNTTKDEFCAMCDAARNLKGACSFCHGKNSIRTNACFQCCKLKESNSDFLVQSTQQQIWSCSYCAIENAQDSIKCFKCGKSNYCAGDEYVSSYSKLSTENLWTCSFCTWENSLSDTKCFQCQKTKSSRLDTGDGCIFPSNRSASMSTITWSCSYCTTENTMDDVHCFQCGNSEDIIPSAGITNSAASSKFGGLDETPKRRIRCGACGNEGHNRTNATESNCPAYYDENEIARREKQKMKKMEALERERNKLSELKREEEDDEKGYADWLKLTKELQKNHSKSAKYRKGELKRIEKKVQQMEKRQNK
ncbi:hypothetical protein ACHAXS_003481 [Conticribra weissflogii]